MANQEEGEKGGGETQTKVRPQLLLFSATFPSASRKYAAALVSPGAQRIGPSCATALDSDANIVVAEVKQTEKAHNELLSNAESLSSGMAPDIDHRYLIVHPSRKIHLLLALLKYSGWPPQPQHPSPGAHDKFDDRGSRSLAQRRQSDGTRSTKSEASAWMKKMLNEAMAELEATGTDVEAHMSSVAVASNENISVKSETTETNEVFTLSAMKGASLKDKCREKGLKVSGTKADLVERILAARLGNGESDEKAVAKALASGSGSRSSTSTFDKEDWSRVLIFVGTKKEAEKVR